MKNRYKAVIAGLGNIAWQIENASAIVNCGLTHSSAISYCDKTELCGGFSPVKSDRREFEKALAVPSFESLEDMLVTVRPDIVSICSPSQHHYEQSLNCIEHEIPMIWLEKPPANSVGEIESIFQYIRQTGFKSKVLVSYQRRYIPCYQQLKKIYETGVLGDCRYIHLNYSRGLELNGCHMLDILAFILGPDTDIHLDWIAPFEDSENPSFALTTDNGLAIMVSGQSLDYHSLDIALTFAGGRASILHGGMTPVVEIQTEHEVYSGFYRLKQTESELLQREHCDDYMLRILLNLIESYEQNVEPVSNLQTARISQKIIEKVRSAGKAAR